MIELRKEGQVGVEVILYLNEQTRQLWEPGFRHYHVRKVVSSRTCEAAELGRPCENELANRLSSIPGVEKVFIMPYQINVFRAEMYNWEEIEPEILLLINAFLEAM